MKQYEAPRAEWLSLASREDCLSSFLAASNENEGGGILPPEDDGWTESIK